MDRRYTSMASLWTKRTPQRCGTAPASASARVAKGRSGRSSIRVGAVWLLALTLALPSTGCATRQQAVAAQWLGAGMMVVGTGFLMAGASKMNRDPSTVDDVDDFLDVILVGPELAAWGVTGMLAGGATLAGGTIARDQLRHRDERSPQPERPSPWLTSASPSNSSLTVPSSVAAQPTTSRWMASRAAVAPSEPTPAQTSELDLILADLCALYESECVTIQACLRHGSPVACATVDELTVTGVVSGPVWRIARAGVGL
jgi:hypothetical protein